MLLVIDKQDNVDNVTREKDKRLGNEFWILIARSGTMLVALHGLC